MIHLGITGTRHGANEVQLRNLHELLAQLTPAWLHHGCCKGFDEQAHYATRELLPDCKVHGHPAVLDMWQSSTVSECDTNSKPQTFLHRNLDIISAVEAVIAAPLEMDEQRRGGTWYTIRAARQRRRPLYVLLPNGHVLVENVNE